jgi:hypothetical protein
MRKAFLNPGTVGPKFARPKATKVVEPLYRIPLLRQTIPANPKSSHASRGLPFILQMPLMIANPLAQSMFHPWLMMFVTPRGTAKQVPHDGENYES